MIPNNIWIQSTTKAGKTQEIYNLPQISQQSTYGRSTNTHSHVLMTQMSVSRNREIWSKRKQCADEGTKKTSPKREDKLTCEDRQRALRYLIFI